MITEKFCPSLNTAIKSHVGSRRGVPFKRHFYVPEVHPITKEEFHEGEDDARCEKLLLLRINLVLNLINVEDSHCYSLWGPTRAKT